MTTAQQDSSATPERAESDPNSQARASLRWHFRELGRGMVLAMVALLEKSWLPWVVLAVSVGTAVASAALLSGRDLSAMGGGMSWTVIALDAAVVCVVGTLLALKIASMVRHYSRQTAQRGNLPIRMSLFLGALVLAPTLMMTLFALALYAISLDSWFDQRVRRAIDASQVISSIYLDESTDAIRLKGLMIARDLDRNAIHMATPGSAQELFSFISEFRSVTDAALFRVFPGSQVETVARFGSRITFDDPIFSQEILARADAGEAVLFGDDGDSQRYRAVLVELTNLPYTYLYLVRYIDTRVAEFSSAAREASMAYDALDTTRTSVQTAFRVIFVLIALLFTISAVWIGIGTGQKLVQPIYDLIQDSIRLRRRVPFSDISTRRSGGFIELELLSESFAETSRQLMNQRRQLEQSNASLIERSQFIEAVLGGINSGVIGLDKLGRIQIANSRAAVILGSDIDARRGEYFVDCVPIMAPIVEPFLKRQTQIMMEQYLQIPQDDGQSKSVVVHVIPRPDNINPENSGAVVTIDDMTTLINAERQAAWSDVARRVAHEIKNPLTPIQLAAERLLNRCLPGKLDIPEADRDVFAVCSESILRHVGVIQRMVTEFSSYARTPRPILQKADIVSVVRETVFDQKNVDSDNEYLFTSNVESLEVDCDRRLLQQALSNVLINAVQAHQKARVYSNTDALGAIRVSVEDLGQHVDICIDDCGLGFGEKSMREKYLEPYFSGPESLGSGLGLVIVSKIFEDHGGTIRLEDAPRADAPHGARVRLRLPKEAQRVDRSSLSWSDQLRGKETVGQTAWTPSHVGHASKTNNTG